MTESAMIKVWDVAVRIFHWSLVVVFFVAYLSGDDDSVLHVYVGYAALALVAFRIVWGVVGTKHARFTDFVHGPAATLRYVRSVIAFRPIHYLGHNPLGGWMVVALLASLVGVCWSGLEVYGKQGHGPLARVETQVIASAIANDDERDGRRERGEKRGKAKGEEFWGDVHEAFSDLTLLFVFLHVAGVLLASAIHRENLVKAMITGYKFRRPL